MQVSKMNGEYRLFEGSFDFGSFLFGTNEVQSTSTSNAGPDVAGCTAQWNAPPRPIIKTEQDPAHMVEDSTPITTDTTTMTTTSSSSSPIMVFNRSVNKRGRLRTLSCSSGGSNEGMGQNTGGVQCAFCKRNGETREFYSTHILKDWRGMVVCPVLRAYTCPRCGATGDSAHTESHCPLFGNEPSLMATLRTQRRSCGKKAYSWKHQ